MQCPGCQTENPAAARFCSACGRPVGSADGASAAEGETRPLTILFADMSSSVETTYELDPEATAGVIDEVLKVMTEAVHRHGGQINSLLGDGVLAFFGTPQAHEDDPERAILAALEIRDVLRGRGLNATAGIDTGAAYVGRVGSAQRKELGARGRVINVAARLQAQARPGQVIVGEATYRLARRSFDFSPLTVEVKGVGGGLPAYEVHRALPRRQKVRGIEGLHGKLQGRDAEVAALTAALSDLRNGRGGLALILGDAGVGKSRLVHELKQAAFARSGDAASPRWLEGRCLEAGTTTSYLPFVDVLSDYFAWGPDADGGAREERLAAAIRELTGRGDLAAERVEQVSVRLAGLLSPPSPGDRPIDELTPERLKTETFFAVRDFLVALARRRPLVLVLDDLHWADTLSLGLTSLLLETLTEAPILLVCAMRPEPEHKWRRLASAAAQKCGDRCVELRLSELSSWDAAELLRSLLGLGDLPAGLTPIVERAQGNPFFLEELLRSLIDAQIVVREDGDWRVGEGVESVTVPETVQGVILSRVDRLDEQQREILQTAAVIGRLFRPTLLAQLVGGGEELDQALWELEGRQLIYEDRVVPEVEYSFKHVLTQETVYRSLLRPRRAQLHGGVAGAIETLYADRLEEHYDELAHHYERSDAEAKAAEYLYLAGEKARRAFSNDEAVAYFRRGLARLRLLPPDQRRPELAAQLNEGLARVLFLTGNHEEAHAAFAEALASTTDDEPLKRARLLCGLAETARLKHRYDDAAEALDRAEQTLGPPRDEGETDWWREWVELHIRRINYHYFRNELEQIEELVEAIRPRIEGFGTPAQRASFFAALGTAGMRRHRFVPPDEVLGFAEAGLAAARESADELLVGEREFMLGFTHLWRGDLDAAERHMRSALAKAERLGSATTRARCLAYLPVVERKRACVADARRLLPHALAAADVVGLVEYRSLATANESWIAWREGRLEEAEEKARRALALWADLPARYPFDWTALWPLVGVALARGRVEEAVECARRLLDPDQQPPPEHLRRLLERAIDAGGRGDEEAARVELEPALESARALGYA